MTRVQIVYRASPASSTKERPPWFSKALCLGSLLRSAGMLKNVDFAFVVDGMIPEQVTTVMRRYGSVAVLHNAGNSGSYRGSVRRALGSTQDGWVFMCEDDYLFRLGAVHALQGAADLLGAGTYLTPYDHPDRYLPGHDWRVRGAMEVAVGEVRWRSVESTTMTYATLVETLAKDAWLHRLATVHGTPLDRQLWLLLQAPGWVYGVARLARFRRRLLGPVPSMATHCEAAYLAPGVDWASEADEVQDWIDRELPSLRTAGW